MMEYSYRDGDKILQNLIMADDKEDLYILSNHIKRANFRKINLDYVKEMLLNNEPLGVLLSRKNRFKIFYPSEYHQDLDLIVVIAIDVNQKIIGVTTYEDKKTHRKV